jgi:hypothetical protein
MLPAVMLALVAVVVGPALTRSPPPILTSRLDKRLSLTLVEDHRAPLTCVGTAGAVLAADRAAGQLAVDVPRYGSPAGRRARAGARMSVAGMIEQQPRRGLYPPLEKARPTSRVGAASAVTSRFTSQRQPARRAALSRRQRGEIGKGRMRPEREGRGDDQVTTWTDQVAAATEEHVQSQVLGAFAEENTVDRPGKG